MEGMMSEISFDELCLEHASVAENAVQLEYEARMCGYDINDDLFWNPVREIWDIIDQSIARHIREKRFSWNGVAPLALRLSVRPRLSDLEKEINEKRGLMHLKLKKCFH